MDFEKFLEKAAKELDREVERILEGQLKKAEKTDKKLIPLLKAFTSSCHGGKRIRGALIKLGYQIGDGKSEEIIKISAAYEICHSAVLAHDDIIDESLTRRGQPSLYAALGNGHYGISQAISLADYGFFLALKIISGARFPQDRKIKALELFSGVMTDTALGEMLDLEDTDPLTVMKLKTACYTISGPLQLGALLAGANERLTRVLGEFGESLGIAFQIRDDILDGEAEKYSLRCFKNKALKCLPRITKNLKMSKLLQQMAEYLIERNK